MIVIGNMDDTVIRGVIGIIVKINIEIQTDKQTDRLWIWVGGWMGGWMETKVGLRDCLAQSKNILQKLKNNSSFFTGICHKNCVS